MQAVPVVTVWIGIFPLAITPKLSLAATLYLSALFGLLFRASIGDETSLISKCHQLIRKCSNRLHVKHHILVIDVKLVPSSFLHLIDVLACG